MSLVALARRPTLLVVVDAGTLVHPADEPYRTFAVKNTTHPDIAPHLPGDSGYRQLVEPLNVWG